MAEENITMSAPVSSIEGIGSQVIDIFEAAGFKALYDNVALRNATDFYRLHHQRFQILS